MYKKETSCSLTALMINLAKLSATLSKQMESVTSNRDKNMNHY
jgi:hypothetical protein